MIPVAEYDGTTIYVPRDAFISFFNSPYIAHQSLSAVDIYNTNLSPVEGIVEKIHRFKSNECAIILHTKKHAVKILHVLPSVKVGERIHVGDELGTLIKSPFFRPWSDKHIHIEIRPRHDVLRARNAYKLKILGLGEPSGTSRIKNISKISENYVLVSATAVKCGIYHGFGVKGIIDGGFPHYKYGGAFFDPRISENLHAGEIVKEEGSVKFVKFDRKEIFLNGAKLKGIGFYLFFKPEIFIKAIILQQHSFSAGEKAMIKFL